MSRFRVCRMRCAKQEGMADTDKVYMQLYLIIIRFKQDINLNKHEDINKRSQDNNDKKNKNNKSTVDKLTKTKL